MFKVGDIIKGTLEGYNRGYTRTNQDSTCEVIEIRDATKDLKVKIIGHKTKPKHIGETWFVDPKYFVSTKITNWRDRIGNRI